MDNFWLTFFVPRPHRRGFFCKLCFIQNGQHAFKHLWHSDIRVIALAVKIGIKSYLCNKEIY